MAITGSPINSIETVPYTTGYYTELNPANADLALLQAGFVAPAFRTCCELGYGQGLSLNIHAAAGETDWWGTDFNAGHAAFAQDLAQASGAAVTAVDQDFASFCARDDLPDFDMIGLHGIWSWISAENRTVIADFIRRKLKIGGVVYVSYNTLPGWAAMLPLRAIMADYAGRIAPRGTGTLGKVDAMLGFLDDLGALKSGFFDLHPQVRERIKRTRTLDRQYLVHEYLAEVWEPMTFADVASVMADAKMTFAISANPLDRVDSVNLTAEQAEFLRKIDDPAFRQTVRDLLSNQQFRRDYWIKGPRRMSVAEQRRQFEALTVMLTRHPKNVPLEASGALGKVPLRKEIFEPIIVALSDHEPRQVSDMLATLKRHNLGYQQVREAITILIGVGAVSVVRPNECGPVRRSMADRLNARIARHSRAFQDIRYLASPMTGGGVPVGRFDQLFLSAMASGVKSPEEIARFCWNILDREGQKIRRDDKVLEGPDEHVKALKQDVKIFLEEVVPILEALKVRMHPSQQ